jgi:hypothetical protein
MFDLYDVHVGDVIRGTNVYKTSWTSWSYMYEILDIEPVTTRFGNPDRILTVKVSTSDTGYVTDYSTKRWASQLF